MDSFMIYQQVEEFNSIDPAEIQAVMEEVYEELSKQEENM